MQNPRRYFKKQNPLLPGLGTEDEREELSKIIETKPDPITIPEHEGRAETEIKPLSDFVL